MSDAVAFDSVSKTYRRGHAPSLRDEAARLLRLGAPHAHGLPDVDALHDVSFTIDAGTSFALMGANGSGKTTALKLISRVTYPSRGCVSVRGRVGALIEVGTGLHPELTGRENVWWYGRILGLNREAIARHFDAILDFSGIGDAIDQPVKQYSSGMQLRLGFSLAAHLEPDVLIVDEAVAVGDAAFQRRCVERMSELHRAGATLIFVTHLPVLASLLCTQGALLHEGRLAARGPVDDIVAMYDAEMAGPVGDQRSPGQALQLTSWEHEVTPGPGSHVGDLTVRLRLHAAGPVREPRFSLAIAHPRAGSLVAASMLGDDAAIGTLDGDSELTCCFADLPLQAGTYDLWLHAMDEQRRGSLLGPQLLGRIDLGDMSPFSALSLRLGARPEALPLVRAEYAWSIRAANAATPDAAAALVGHRR